MKWVIFLSQKVKRSHGMISKNRSPLITVWESVIGFYFYRPVTPIIDAIGNAIDSVHTSTEEKMQMRLVLEKLRQEPAKLQIELNKIEAAHRTLFVAGGRPFIIWVCGAVMLYGYLMQPIISFFLVYNGHPHLPLTNLKEMYPVLFAILGLSGMRSWEKKEGLTS